MWVVYNYKTREKHFEGTTEQCVQYIDNMQGGWKNPVDMMPKKYFKECALPIVNTTNELKDGSSNK